MFFAITLSTTTAATDPLCVREGSLLINRHPGFDSHHETARVAAEILFSMLDRRIRCRAALDAFAGVARAIGTDDPAMSSEDTCFFFPMSRNPVAQTA